MRIGAPLANAPMRAEKADLTADVGGSGNDDLDRLAAALRVENVEFDAVLLEDAGVLAQLRHEGFADAAAALRELETILRLRGWCGREDRGDSHADERSRPMHAMPPQALVAAKLARSAARASRAK